jgi:hypothetical protein
MIKIRTGLTGLIVFIALTLTSGCMPATPEGHADRVFKQMQTIHKAATDYQNDHGSLPAGNYKATKEKLISGDYIKSFPLPHPSIFGTPNPEGYRFSTMYARMDAGPNKDAAIVLWGLKDEICKAFNTLYSSNNSGPTIFDYEAAGKKYPGEAIGRNMLIYAIKWRTHVVDDCEVNWVLEYNE